MPLYKIVPNGFWNSAEAHEHEECEWCGRYLSDKRGVAWLYHKMVRVPVDEEVVLRLEGMEEAPV